MEQKVILRAEKINKSFPGVKALSDVSFDLREGEVHILMGENGAGKSTLMKIFSGLYSVDSGKIYIDEKPVVIRNTKDSQDLGIASQSASQWLRPPGGKLKSTITITVEP